MLAIPPGYASPVFPAAGLALVAALRLGTPALGGILLGSVVLNLGHAAVRGNLTTATALVAVVLGMGAAAQAFTGRWLVLRAAGPAWQRMEREQDALRFLLLGGVLAGTVACTIAVRALRVAGVISHAEIPFTWWNWYVGDVVGVLVFAPLILCLLGGPDRLWRERRRTIVLPMLVTFALAILAFYGGARWERQMEDAKLQGDGEIISERIADRIIVHREMLASLRNFLLAQPGITFEQFEEFTRRTLQENPDVFARSVNDVVPDERRAPVEAALRRVPRLGPFQITLETILRTALDGFWVTDREGRLVDVNPAACDMLGYSRDELLRMRVDELEVESAEPGAPHHPGPHRASGVGRFEARHRRKDGRVIDVEISAQFLPVRGGRFVTFIRDVTARRVAEEQLRQSQKMEAVGQLAGGIAHDFNNLLTVMLSASGFAMESAPPEGQLREDIAEFQAAAEKARALTKQLLAFSPAARCWSRASSTSAPWSATRSASCGASSGSTSRCGPTWRPTWGRCSPTPARSSRRSST